MMNAILSGLVNGAVLAFVLTVFVGLALRVTSRRTLNAATRYFIWWAMLVAAVSAPLFFTHLPLFTPLPRLTFSEQARSKPATNPIYAAKVKRADSPPTSMPIARHDVPTPAHSLPGAGTGGRGQGFAVPRAQPIQADRSTLSFPIRFTPAGWLRWLAVPWLLASAFLLGRLLTSLVMLNCLKRRASPAPPTLALRIGQWDAACGGERRDVRLAISSEIETPVAAGPLRPTILIPATLIESFEDDDLDRICLHEMAHLARRDDYALIAQRILEAIFIPYPLIMWIARRIDLEREIACDDLVIASIGRPRSYAACLARILESAQGTASPWPAVMATGGISQLSHRVDVLLDRGRSAGAHLMKSPLAATTALLLTLLFAAGKTPGLIAFAGPAAMHLEPSRLVIPRYGSMLAAAAQAQPEQPSAVTEMVAGLVLEDHTGNPLPSAELRFRKPGMRELSADLETDSQGRFDTTGLRQGEYSIDVSKANYIPASFRISVPSPQPPANSLNVRLIRYGVIDGQATDTAGRPLAGTIHGPSGRSVGSARITVLTKDAAEGEFKTVREAALDDEGRYRIYDLAPGEYAVGLWYSGQKVGSGMQLYPDTANPKLFAVSGGEEYTGINFTAGLQSTSDVSGRVKVPAGVNGQFQLALGLASQPLLPIAQTLTEEDGSFHFANVPMGNYDLFVAGPTFGYGQFDSTLEKADSLFGRTSVQASGQNIADLVIPLSAARVLHIVLRAHGSADPPSGCAASANVTLKLLEPWALLLSGDAQVAWGKEGTVPNLPPGKFRVMARDLGPGCFQANDAIADLRPETPDPVIIELASAGAIHGMLRGGAAGGVAGAAIVLMELGSNSRAGEAKTRLAYPDSSGKFEYGGLPPSHYRIAAYASGKTPGMTGGQEINVSSGAPTNVELAAPKAEGRTQ